MKTIYLNLSGIAEEIRIRELSSKDLKNVKKSLNLLNSLIEEDALILLVEKSSFKKEKEWMKAQIKKIKEKSMVFIVAEDNNKFIGTAEIHLGIGRREHIGQLGINIRKGYREMGIGTCLMKEIIKLARRNLKPKPKFIRLNTLVINKLAIEVYKKCHFKAVAIIPKQMNFKGKPRDEVIMLRPL